VIFDHIWAAMTELAKATTKYIKTNNETVERLARTMLAHNETNFSRYAEIMVRVVELEKELKEHKRRYMNLENAHDSTVEEVIRLGSVVTVLTKRQAGLSNDIDQLDRKGYIDHA
jgi:predicted KAP-like P-loop ATPase